MYIYIIYVYYIYIYYMYIYYIYIYKYILIFIYIYKKIRAYKENIAITTKHCPIACEETDDSNVEVEKMLHTIRPTVKILILILKLCMINDGCFDLAENTVFLLGRKLQYGRAPTLITSNKYL